MTLGRLGSFAVILAASLALATALVQRHRTHAVSGFGGFAGFQSSPPEAPSSSPGAGSRTERDRTAPARQPVAVDPAVRGDGGAPPPLENDAARFEDPLSVALCPKGMLLVDGVTCGEREPRCLRADPSSRGACLEYAPAACRQGLSVRVCVDRFEYPNLEGMLPATLIPFDEAKSSCSEEGKRLCTETEWLFACEGPRALAFSYADIRDERACNVGRLVPELRPEALWEPADIGPALARVDARSRSGSMPCASSFGVRDLIGNVEEWVQSDSAGFESALKGGGYSSEPACRSTRLIRQSGFREVHTGFRCCRDPLIRVPKRATPNGAQPGPGPN